MTGKKNSKVEIRKRIKADPDGEQAEARERLSQVQEEIASLALFFETLSQATSIDKVSEQAEEVWNHLECAQSDCTYALSQMDGMGDAQAANLLAVLQEKINISYDKKII